jgi:hypothetical protein
MASTKNFISNFTSCTEMPGTTAFVEEINRIIRQAYFLHHTTEQKVAPGQTVVIIGDRAEPVARVAVWKFSTNPDSYDDLSKSLEEWLIGEDASWVIKNSISMPECICNYDFTRWTLDCIVRTHLAGKALTEFMLTRKLYD